MGKVRSTETRIVMVTFQAAENIIKRIFSKIPGGRCGASVVFLLLIIFQLNVLTGHSQTNYYAQGSYQSSNYIKSSVFRQEIARFEINVVRGNKAPLPITQVPRVQQGDILKIRLLDEAVGGVKLDQSLWDWTFLVTYINPNRKITEAAGGKALKDKSGTISEEIQFRKRGWYREYSFTVPYDSQPVFFLYPRPKYRKQLLKVVSRKYEDLRKLGEKTIEIAGAYAQISSFLNELQMVLNRNAQLYGYTYNGTSSTYNPGYYYGYPNNQNNPNNQPFGLDTIPMMNQIVAGLARSFNIQLPSCWGDTSNYNNYGNYLGGYNSGYSSSYGSYGSNGNTTADFINRAQCVAKNVNLEDFDLSIMKMWQQGGVFLAAELQKKYPQLAYWINIAAVAIDFIVRAFQKSPLRIVPTMVQSSDNQANGGYQNNYSSYSSNTNNQSGQAAPVKISLFAESQPSEGQFVTAYPIVVHKWQQNPDPEVISLYSPVLAEPCLHAGQNILKNTDLSEQWSEDTYSRDFKLVMSSQNGFRKEFPLRKNIGLGGWELNITPEELNQIPKINMTLESEMVGMRGFNEIKSKKFDLPLAVGGAWEITPESQKNFAVGGRRKITLRNTLGSCRCLQRVIYKPSFGGQFVFEASGNQNNPNALQFSSDGREVSFEIDTGSFQPGAGTLEIKTYGNDNQMSMNQSNSNNLNLKLYPLPPNITNFRIARNDNQAIMAGDRLEQIQFVKINGKRAVVIGNTGGNQPGGSYQNQSPPTNLYLNQPGSSSQGTYINPNNPPTDKQNMPPNSSTAGGSGATAAATALANLSAPLMPNERLLVFEDKNARQTDSTVLLELGLDDNRTLQYPQSFSAGLSRPAFMSNESREIEGIPIQGQGGGSEGRESSGKTIQNSASTISSLIPDPLSLSVLPIETGEIQINARNILTDYDFKVENISIETRFEKSQTGAGYGIEQPRVSFEILDWKNLRITLKLSDGLQKLLGGRRLQFKLRDRERGDSDWYTIRQTFVRFPQIESVRCTTEMNNQCELKGPGIDYIGQISIDGGQSWYPQPPNLLTTQPSPDGQKIMMIPLITDKKLLRIKLRDYPNMEGLIMDNFLFSNTVKTIKPKPAQPANQTRKPPLPDNTPPAAQKTGATGQPKPKEKAP